MMRYLFFLFLFLVGNLAGAQSGTSHSVSEIAETIERDPASAVKMIRSRFGPKILQNGNHWIEGSTILWIIESREPASVIRKDGELIARLTGLADSGIRAAAKKMENPVTFDYVMKSESGKEILSRSVKIEYYDYPPESSYREGIPRGSITRHSFPSSRIFPNTRRELEVYIPVQYEKGKPVSLLVFQDGLRHAQVDSKGGLRVPVVLDNLIAAGDMPVTVGVFINPGSHRDQPANSKPRNRSFEYDSLGDQYVNFLLEEIIPFVEKEHGILFSEDPAHRAIAGGSSGCACAWTAAWERPDKFGKVLGWVGTFVDIRGANAYPSLIRKTERKNIRIALLGETQDLDNRFGNWPLANQQMETALAFQKYDYRYWWGNGFHGSRHAAVMLPEMLRWLWTDVRP